MKKIKLQKIRHKGEIRIKTLFEKRADLISKVKTIQGRRWSKTKNCWHLPYTNESFKALKNVFGESNLEYPNKEKIEIYSTEIEPQFVDYQSDGKTYQKVIGKKIILKKRSKKWIEAYVPFEKKGWVEAIRNIVGRQWDIKKTVWLLPNVKATYRHLKKNIGLKNLIFDFKIESDIPEETEMPKVVKKIKATIHDLLNEQQKEALKATEEQLLLKRYSPWTLKSYRNHLAALFSFHSKIEPKTIGTKEIQSYLLHQIRHKKIAESTQNQIINAYKAYVEKVLKRPKEFIEIPRPKRPKKLPNVLSVEEVLKILNASKNLKHKLALLLIYAAGLRKSELLNLLKEDVNIDRKAIHIKGGKGKKDRYVVLAESAIPYLLEYLKIYEPVRWLFEGQTGGTYSASSLQKVFNKALEKSKVNPYATIHTLRHSYATHCVEKGYDLKLVQDALGHSSLSTTEVYLHISSNALKKLGSPLDDLNLK